MISLTKDKRMLGYASLNVYPNILHFVTTRQGGCGEGAYATFNCSHYCGDSPEHVQQNRRMLLDGLSCKPKELVIPIQVHGTEILCIDNAYLSASREQKERMLNGVDALITRETDCCLCVSTADCVPVLLYDKAHQVVAVVHAGWRGTVAGIVRDTLKRMNVLFGTEGGGVIVCIGPSISLDSFEVGEEVYEAFREKGFDMPRISMWNQKTDKHHIDLWESNRIQLLEFGIPACQIESADICTYIHHENFFSARRLGIKSGRILSGISILS